MLISSYFFIGTFAPASRALEIPMAIAWSLFLTFFRCRILNPLTLLLESVPQDKLLLTHLEKNKKKKLVDRYWLGLLKELSPRKANFIRDYLWITLPEKIAFGSGISEKQAAKYFVTYEDSLKNPAIRVAYYLNEYGD